MTPRFICPPHPTNISIPPEMLQQHEKQGAWIAQRKFNGSNSVIWLYQDQIQIWNRRGQPFGTYQITEGMKKCLLYGLNRDYDVEYVLNGELLHTKAKLPSGKQSVENVIVLFDVLYAGKFLTDLTTLERIDLLNEIAPPNGFEPKKRALSVTEYNESQVWLVETFHDDFNYRFWEMYDSTDSGEDNCPEIEGLVLKLKTAKNTSISTKSNDVSWILRCRKTKKLYQF